MSHNHSRRITRASLNFFTLTFRRTAYCLGILHKFVSPAPHPSMGFSGPGWAQDTHVPHSSPRGRTPRDNSPAGGT